MGAWGKGNFENDTTLDWVKALISSEGNSVIIETFDTIQLNKHDYLEVDECHAALAAAEVVAALAGNPSSGLPKKVIEWLGHQPSVDKVIRPKARRAVMAILGDSELRELIEDVNGLEEWCTIERDLIQRLG